LYRVRRRIRPGRLDNQNHGMRWAIGAISWEIRKPQDKKVGLGKRGRK
jgi:hypothetical protein